MDCISHYTLPLLYLYVFAILLVNPSDVVKSLRSFILVQEVSDVLKSNCIHPQSPAREVRVRLKTAARTPGFDDLTAMATTNGALTPPAAPGPVRANSPAEVADLKRKREDDESQPHPLKDATSSRNAQTQKDILEILEQYVQQT